MSANTLYKKSREGTGYSTVDLGDVRHVFVAAVPRNGTTLSQQAVDALRIIESATHAEGICGSIVQQTVFLSDPGQIDVCRRIMHDFYGHDLPATSYIPQPPCGGKLLAVECLGIGQGRGDVNIRRVNEQLVIARHNGITWAHCATAGPQKQTLDAYDDATNGFEQLRTLLNCDDISFDRVIRTWLYCGGITDREGVASNYQGINRARADFYRDINFLNNGMKNLQRKRIYPASTGIGVGAPGVMLGAIALSTDREDITIVPLENPRQTPACDYSSHYSPVSPEFSRAMAISCDSHVTIFISGTASIIASETRHAGDAAAQTHETLDNIAELICEENLRRHGLPGLGASLNALAMARVYVKRREDYATVQDICHRRLHAIPIIYAQADICRPELLVEIEGIAFSSKTITFT